SPGCSCPRHSSILLRWISTCAIQGSVGFGFPSSPAPGSLNILVRARGGEDMADMSEEQRRQRAAKRALNAALAAEAEDRRQEDKRQRWEAEGVYLTWEEFEADVPCRGCGQPWVDGLGDWPALIHLTAEKRVA